MPFLFEAEVVLVFPRPNETYYPTYFFPIVYGLTSGAESWPYEFNTGWDLEVMSPDAPWAAEAMDFRGFGCDFSQPPPAGKPYYMINGSGIVVNQTTVVEWKLSWSVSMLRECEPSVDGMYWQYGDFRFFTSYLYV